MRRPLQSVSPHDVSKNEYAAGTERKRISGKRNATRFVSTTGPGACFGSHVRLRRTGSGDLVFHHCYRYARYGNTMVGTLSHPVR